MVRRAPTRLWAWSALGLAGSLLIALVAPRALNDHVVGWWYGGGLAITRSSALRLTWIGMALLAIAWLAIALGGASDPAVALTRRRATIVGLAWALPLVLAPPLFSRDVYSYLAQGTLLHLGHNPYRQAPTALAPLGHARLLAAVSPSWRHTTAPYGPLFLQIMSGIVAVCGGHLIAGVLLCRALDLAGLALLAIAIPQIARATGGDGARGVWLATASPLGLLTLLAAAHNDLLMVGLLATGLAAALRGRPLLGIVLCALAAAIKAPALLGAAFIAVAWARSEPALGARLRLLAAGSAAVLAVLGAVTLTSGVGLDWLSSTVFSAPAHAHLVLTPAVAAGATAADVLRDLGVDTTRRSAENAAISVFAVLTALAILASLARARVTTLVTSLGAVLVLAAIGGPAAWPWYLAWGLIPLCGDRAIARLRLLPVVLAVSAFLVAPDGVVVVPVRWAPIVAAAEFAVAWAAYRHWRLRRVQSAGAPPDAEALALDEPRASAPLAAG